MGMGGGYPGMGMMGGSGMIVPMPHAGGVPGVPLGPSPAAADGSLQPFDSSQMKRGRLGHYGYLEGRGESSYAAMWPSQDDAMSRTCGSPRWSPSRRHVAHVQWSTARQ